MALVFDQKMFDGSIVKSTEFVKIRGASSVRQTITAWTHPFDSKTEF